MDDRAPARLARRRRRRRRSWSTTSSRASARRARSGFSSTSAIRRCGCSTAGSARGSRGGLPVTRDAAPAPTSEWTGTREAQHASRPGARCRRRSASRMPSFSTRAATASTAARPCAPRAAAPSRAPCTSSGPATSAPTARSSPPPSCEQMYERRRRHPDREVITYCQGGYRAAHSYLALRLLGYPTRPQLRRIVEGMGRPRRSADRNAGVRATGADTANRGAESARALPGNLGHP